MLNAAGILITLGQRGCPAAQPSCDIIIIPSPALCEMKDENKPPKIKTKKKKFVV